MSELADQKANTKDPNVTAEPKHKVPRRKPGWGKGPRRFNGAVLDVSGAAEFLGSSHDYVRSRAARGQLPYRRWGGRLVFLRGELEQFLAETLPGVTLEQVQQNIEARRGTA